MLNMNYRTIPGEPKNIPKFITVPRIEDEE
jgi:hypothetical protein